MAGDSLPKQQHFAEFYNSFSREVIAENASANQRRDLRMAFYGGAAAILLLLQKSADMTDKEGVDFISSVHQEIDRFMEEIAPRRPYGK